MSAPETLRVLVMGAVKHDYILHGMAAHPRYELLAVTDDEAAPDWAHKRNAATAAALGLPYRPGVSAALARFQPQVACVSPEVPRHADLSVQAADAGLHVVQDKPLALSLADCDRIVAAVERAGVRFLMWSRNTFPAIRQAKAVLAAGDLGQPYAIHVDFYFAKDAGALLGSGEPEEIEVSWDGLGELTLEGIYPLAYLHELLGVSDAPAPHHTWHHPCGAGASLVRRVFARTTAHFFQRHADRGVEDLGSVTLEMDNGIVGSLCIGRIGEPSHPNIGELKLHILGTKGAFVAAEPRPEVSVYARGLKPGDYRQRRVGLDYERRLLDNFAEAVDTGADTMMTARDSRAIAATVLAAIESGQTGRPVEVSSLGAS